MTVPPPTAPQCAWIVYEDWLKVNLGDRAATSILDRLRHPLQEAAEDIASAKATDVRFAICSISRGLGMCAPTFTGSDVEHYDIRRSLSIAKYLQDRGALPLVLSILQMGNE